MSQESQTIKNALTNVIGAFRTLASYQQSMLSIVNYIKNRSGIKNARIYGAKRFSSPIRKCQLKEDYDATLNIFPDMWSWDFLYGYMFEYYLGTHRLATKNGEKDVSISIIQVSDDGFIISQQFDKTRTNLDAFNSPEESNSWLLILVGYGDGWYFIPEIMTKETYSPTAWTEVAFQTISHIVKSSKSIYINRIGVDGSDCFFFAKKVPLGSFFDAQNIESILADISNQLNKEAGLNLFAQ